VFYAERFALVGVLCLAASLAIKPHDVGLVWLYFLLAGGVYRKRALQSLLITAVLGLSAFLWVSHVAPHWIGDWNSNLIATSSYGGINGPGFLLLTAVLPPWSSICKRHQHLPGRSTLLQHGQLPGLRRASIGLVSADAPVALFAEEPGLRWRPLCP